MHYILDLLSFLSILYQLYTLSLYYYIQDLAKVLEIVFIKEVILQAICLIPT